MDKLVRLTTDRKPGCRVWACYKALYAHHLPTIYSPGGYYWRFRVQWRPLKLLGRQFYTIVQFKKLRSDSASSVAGVLAWQKYIPFPFSVSAVPAFRIFQLPVLTVLYGNPERTSTFPLQKKTGKSGRARRRWQLIIRPRPLAVVYVYYNCILQSQWARAAFMRELTV